MARNIRPFLTRSQVLIALPMQRSATTVQKEMSQYAMNSDEYNLMLRYYENVADLDIRNAATDPVYSFSLAVLRPRRL